MQSQRVAVARGDRGGGAEGQPASAAEVKPARENRERHERLKQSVGG